MACRSRRCRAVLRSAAMVWLQLTVAAPELCAHDPSAYGGLFRSRNLGQSWVSADTGLFVNAALSVAVDPRDPAHLLFGTDVGLMESRSGGRGWSAAATGTVIGAVSAVAFSPDTGVAIIAAPSGIFRSTGQGWTPAASPAGAAPARAIAFGGTPQRVFLLGAGGVFISDDGGLSFTAAASSPGNVAPPTALAVQVQPDETVFAVAGGRLFASRDAAASWQDLGIGDAADPVEAVDVDASAAGRLWTNAGIRILLSDDSGRTWGQVGMPLPERGTKVRGIAADGTGRSVVVTTHRGMYRSSDGGQTWELKEGNLPIHLESGPLARDPSDAASLYAIYSLIPYAEAWRMAVEGGSLLSRADPVGLAGALALLLLLLICGALLVRWLARRRGAAIRVAR